MPAGPTLAEEKNSEFDKKAFRKEVGLQSRLRKKKIKPGGVLLKGCFKIPAAAY